MKPKKRTINYERVRTDDFIPGVIEEVQRDEEHQFKYKGEVRIADAVRFKFKLEGYEFPHYSRWMTFTYGAQSNLYNKYLVSLVEAAKPDMDFDIKQLEGASVKTLWAGEDYQSPETIRINGMKLVKPSVTHEQAENEPDEEVPF